MKLDFTGASDRRRLLIAVRAPSHPDTDPSSAPRAMQPSIANKNPTFLSQIIRSSRLLYGAIHAHNSEFSIFCTNWCPIFYRLKWFSKKGVKKELWCYHRLQSFMSSNSQKKKSFMSSILISFDISHEWSILL